MKYNNGNRIGAIYSATDKAIFDALQQYKVTRDDLKEIFFTRGIIISNKTDKEVLASNFSRYIHGYEDYEFLSKILGVSSQKERMRSFDISSDELELDDMEAILTEIKSELTSASDDIVDVSMVGKTLTLKIEYTEPDFTKTEFRQVVDKDAEIVIEKVEGGFTVVGPHNKKMEFISEIIINKSETLDANSKVAEIELDGIVNKAKISVFFEDLTMNMDGYGLVNVTDVYVYNPSKNPGTGSHIKKISLSGTSVTLSQELASLYTKGFYVWKITWVVKDNRDPDSDLYEFEALFSNPEECTDFAYSVKGYYPKKEDEDASGATHHKNRINLNNKHLESKYSRLIIDTAKSALAKALS
ncbi:hypothetical protein [Pantoea dispersa]|uniref:hypothetical protein n=1 Tax=Pantoea dispersa TaxID=59814 RepID=UPI003016B642